MSEELVTDPERLKEIADLDLSSTAKDDVLDELVTRAARELDLPIALVSIVLDSSQHFAAAHGLKGWLAEVRGTPIEWSFCANAVRNREEYVVEDAREHPEVKDNPLVTEDGIGCYAGIPLVTGDDRVLGTLCVIGTEAQEFSESQLEKLREIAEEVSAYLETRRCEDC